VAAVIGALTSCSKPPTQVSVFADTNVDRARPMSLALTAQYGAAPIEALRRADAVLLRADGRTLLPGSFSVVPRADGARSGLVTLLATLQVEASGAQPGLVIERMQSVSLLSSVPLQARLFFNVRCADRATGCSGVASEQCTVSRRCIEQGATCGDDGECVSIELPTQPAMDSAVLALDAAPPADALSGRPDAAALDVSDGATDVHDAASDAPAALPDADAIAPPRLVAPLSTHVVTSQRPTLRWVASPDTNSTRLELCRDRAMTTGCIAPVTVAAPLWRASAPFAAGWWFWRATAVRSGARSDARTPVWQFLVGPRSADGDRDTSWQGPVDFNGDGYADVATGSPEALRGRVEVFLGSRGGLAATPAQTLEGPVANVRFGESVANAGDVNGDGFSDLVVGAYALGNGHARVYFGSATGIAPTPARAWDGFAMGDDFGFSVAGAGDVNADGYGDVVVGARTADDGARVDVGAISVYHGASSGPGPDASRVVFGADPGDLLGWSVSTAGDINADGFADIIAGASFRDAGGRSDAGSVLVFHGSVAGIGPNPIGALDGPFASDRFGSDVACAGDTNGDGYSDIIVGAYFATRSPIRMYGGTASIFAGGLLGVFPASPRVIEGNADSDAFGFSVATAGDVNGDGYSDVVIGGHLVDSRGLSNSGLADLFIGARTGIASTVTQRLEGAASGDWFGRSAVGVGDIDGDGFGELVVGVPLFDTTSNDVGALLVHAGVVTGVRAPGSPFAGSIANGRRGLSVAR
jgi:hypothetical protein